MTVRQLRCMTWNIHRAKGTDGRVDPDRVVDAICSVLAPRKLQVLALQEADQQCRPHSSLLDVQKIANLTGMRYMHDRALRWGAESDGFLGTILFMAPNLRRTHADIIDLPGHCHRGAVSIETMFDGTLIRVISTHLSLSQPLRIVQMRVLGQYLHRRPPMQNILLGDLNEWRPWGGMMFNQALIGTRLSGPLCATFPSTRPVLALDRILTDAPGEVCGANAVRLPETVLASDHLPLEAIVKVP